MTGDQRVLVIEDDDIIRELLVEALREDGYLVEAAGTCSAALQVLGERPPQLILLDLRMPDMDAPTFRARQRALGLAPDVPVIVISASNRGFELGQTIGATAVFPKPFDLPTLLAQIQQSLLDA